MSEIASPRLFSALPIFGKIDFGVDDPEGVDEQRRCLAEQLFLPDLECRRQEQRLLCVGALEKAVVDGVVDGGSEQVGGIRDAQEDVLDGRVELLPRVVFDQPALADDRNAQIRRHGADFPAISLMLDHRPRAVLGQQDVAAAGDRQRRCRSHWRRTSCWRRSGSSASSGPRRPGRSRSRSGRRSNPPEERSDL